MCRREWVLAKITRTWDFSNLPGVCRMSRPGSDLCRTFTLARAVFVVAIAEKPAGRFMIGCRPGG
jgi:hypothetical protein